MSFNICGVHLASDHQTKRNSKGKANLTKLTACNIVNCVLPRSLTYKLCLKHKNNDITLVHCKITTKVSVDQIYLKPLKPHPALIYFY